MDLQHFYPFVTLFLGVVFQAQISVAMKGKWKAFGEFADAVVAHLVKLAGQWNATRLDFVADRYPEISIKNAERTRRAAQGVQRVHILNKDRCVPKQWKKYMSCGKNRVISCFYVRSLGSLRFDDALVYDAAGSNMRTNCACAYVDPRRTESTTRCFRSFWRRRRIASQLAF